LNKKRMLQKNKKNLCHRRSTEETTSTKTICHNEDKKEIGPFDSALACTKAEEIHTSITRKI
jgi:hypothetical protein